MAVTLIIPNQRTADLLGGLAINSAHTFKMALYPSAAALTNAFAAYSATGECPNSGGYTTGGKTLSGAAVASGSNKSWLTFSDPTWTSLTQADIQYAVVYDSTSAGKEVVAIVNMGAVQSPTATDFTVHFPTADASNAFFRVANSNP